MEDKYNSQEGSIALSTLERLRSLKYLEQDISDFLENNDGHENFDEIINYTLRMRNLYGD